MKRSSSSGHIQSYLPTFFDDDEIEVSDILLYLPRLISESKSRNRFQVRWGSKRGRSAVGLSPSPSRRFCGSSSISLSVQKTGQGESETEERRPKVKVESSSPTTPLSFSPSETDEKSKHSPKKVSKKRTREECLEIIDGLVHRGELLRGEIETVKSYHKQLKAFNLELKAKKQELEMLNFRPELSHDHPRIHNIVHQQPCIVDQTACTENFQHPYGQISSGSGLGKVNNRMGPLGIPDLNVAAEETAIGMDSLPQPSRVVVADNRRAKAAEARRRRIIRIKEMKKPFAIKPPQYR